MMRSLRRRWIAVAISVPIVIGLLIVGVRRFSPRYRNQPSEARAPQKPEAPPDLAKLRDQFTSALDALHKDDGATAAKKLASFHFGARAVEEYRIYYLAKAYATSKQDDLARITFARLIERHPRMALADDAGTSLGQLYAMRYGAIPVVTSVGGLRDTVTDPGTGIRFDSATAPALLAAVERAVRKGKGPVAGLSDRRREEPQIDGHHPALRQKVLIPGDSRHMKPGR